MPPADYEAMRDKFIEEGMDEKEAKAKASRIHNARHPEDPVTRDYERKPKLEPKKERKSE